jgi:AcrR family transcriptional regulator
VPLTMTTIMDGPTTTENTSKRLSPALRERQIVEGAIRFFAEVGLDGHTRELAQRLGITQPLLYRYFPTKDALIERVYQEVYEKRRDPAWENGLKERSLPLRDRLKKFYLSYTEVIFSYEWMRIYMHSGLRGAALNKRYIAWVEKRLLNRICRELRHDAGLPSDVSEKITPAEMALVWNLHAGIFYYGIRKYIYEIPVEDNLPAVIDTSVNALFEGIHTTLAQIESAGSQIK